MEKSWYASKTIWGAVLMFIAFIASFLGVTITPDEQAAAIDTIIKIADGVVGLIGLILTIYGRIKAVKPIR